MTLTAYQKRIHRLFHSAVEPRPADLGVNADGVEPAPFPRAVAAEVRATVASVLTSRRGTVYRFGSLVVAFNGAGAFYGVGVEYHGGIQFAPARAKGACW